LLIGSGTVKMVFGKICVGLVLSVVIFEFAEQVKGRFCDGKRDGDYTNPSNCYGFIACSGGIAYDMPCPAGLKFDEKKDACDYNAPCYQDGGWSAWGPWSNCSVFCGLGRKYRTRTCTNPPPSGGGKDCVGPSRQMRFCYKPPCPRQFCKNKSDGDYADPNNRYGFITCSGGLTYYRNCPANLRFNQTLDECVWALI